MNTKTVWGGMGVGKTNGRWRDAVVKRMTD
jgi:hypothetical protein